MNSHNNRSPLSLWLPLILVLVIAAAYVNTLQAPFIFDDNNHIRHNFRIQKLWPVTDVVSATNRPVVDLTLAVNYRFGGLSVIGYHLFNLVIHLCNALLIFLILKSVLNTKWFKDSFLRHEEFLAFFIALCWALHPIQTQSVTYIIQRSELLMGLFYLLTLYSVIRLDRQPGSKVWGIAAIIFCSLGMGSKEVMVTAPIVILIFDRIFLSESFKMIFKKRGWIYGGLALTWFLLFRFATVQRSNALIGGFSFDLVSPLEYALSQPKVICHYIQSMYFPQGLCFDYQWPLAKTAADILPYSLVIVTLLSATTYAIFKNAGWGFWGVWFFFILGPTSSFMPIGDLAFDHRMYLSSLSIIFVTFMGFERVMSRSRIGKQRKAILTIFSLIAMILFVATIQRNKVYRDPEALWRDVLKKRPENMRAYMNLGVSLMQKGRLKEAESYFLKHIELNPISEKGYYNLASVMEQKGDPVSARRYLEEAIRIVPDFYQAHLYLARLFMQEGSLQKADEYVKKALELAPNDPTVISFHGFVLFKMGRIDEAISYYDQALKTRPGDANVYYHKALALAAKGEIDQAQQYFEMVLDQDPDNYLAHFNMGNILAQKGDFQAALHYFQETRRLKPDFKPVQQRIEQIHAVLDK